MKLGSRIIDLTTGKRGHVVSLPVLSRPVWLQGVWMVIDGRRVYTRNWQQYGSQKRKTRTVARRGPINPALLELAERVARTKRN